MIEIRGLEKSFAQRTIFRAGNLKTPSTGIIALTGANGSGKSTLLKILATLMLPTKGEASINGRSIFQYPQEAQILCGYAQSGEQGFYPRLTGEENLRLFANFRNFFYSPKEWTEFPHNTLNTAFQDCSTGMKQSLHLARAIAHQPKILLLDEISRSFDSSLQEKYKNFLLDYGRNNLILTATHDPAEIALANSQWKIENGSLLS